MDIDIATRFCDGWNVFGDLCVLCPLLIGKRHDFAIIYNFAVANARLEVQKLSFHGSGAMERSSTYRIATICRMFQSSHQINSISLLIP